MVELNDTSTFPSDPQTNQPASLLEMAQKVHDDFVEKGRAKAELLESEAQKKHDDLISSAKEFHDISILESESAAAAIVEDAQLSAFTLISDAKIKADGIVSDAHEKTINLEASILKLQEFEAAYRANLQALVSGAQATLAVAELAVEDTELPTPDSDEAPAAESINFAEIIDRALQPDADVIFVGQVRDVETADVDTVEESAETEGVHTEDVVDSDEDSEADEEEITESEDDSEEDEDNSDAAPVIYTLVEETPEAIYYDPLAAKSAIDAATVASILGQSGLDTDSFREPIPAIIGGIGAGKSFPSDEDASVIINANPGAGWSLNSDETDEDVDSDESSADEDENDSEAAHDEDKEDKEKK